MLGPLNIQRCHFRNLSSVDSRALWGVRFLLPARKDSGQGERGMLAEVKGDSPSLLPLGWDSEPWARNTGKGGWLEEQASTGASLPAACGSGSLEWVLDG